MKAKTHVSKLKESWQHLLRDRASRTLTYNDEQFHILEKIKMQETIRVLQDLLNKDCTPAIGQITDSLADWYKMAQTTYLQAEILRKDLLVFRDEMESFAVTLKEAQNEKYLEVFKDAQETLVFKKSEMQKQKDEEEQRRQANGVQGGRVEPSKSHRTSVGESKQVKRALKSILTVQDEVWGILRENTRLIEQFGQLALVTASSGPTAASTSFENEVDEHIFWWRDGKWLWREQNLSLESMPHY